MLVYKRLFRFPLMVMLLTATSLYSYSQQVAPPEAAAPSADKKAYTKDDIDKLIHDNKILILDFSATWCQPCKEMAPVMDEIEKENAGKLKIVHIDYDVNRTLSNAMNVYEIPYLQIYVDGKIYQNVVGMIEKKVLMDMLPKQ